MEILSKNIVLLILILILVALIITTFIILNPPIQKNLPTNKLKIGTRIINIEIAQTTLSQTKGLSGRQGLEKDWGMFFKFSSPMVRTMWMKDMKFGLDVIWIREGKIVNISESVFPKGLGQPIVSSAELIDSFLEVPVGFVKENNLKIGDGVSLL